MRGSFNAEPSRKMRVEITVVLLLALAASIKNVQACPEVCSCSAADVVDCRGQSITAVPTDIPATTLLLLLSDNDIPTLTTDMFSTLTALENLYIDNSNVQTIESGAFNGLTSLTVLSLNSNNLQSIDDAVFDPLSPTLVTLQLAGSNIASISSNYFTGMTTLTTLDLSNNQLTALPDNSFSDLSSVTTFGIEGNSLAAITTNCFNGLTSLATLNLNSNNISSIDAGAFSPLTSLSLVQISSNKLETIPTGVFSSLNSIVEINLASNSIGDLAAGMLSNLPNLETLNLASNQITTVADALNTLTSLLTLDLSGNQYTTIPQTALFSLSNLRTLDLSNNRIDAIEIFAFAGLGYIQVLNLQGNQLAIADNGVFTGLDRLVTLDLSFNLFTTIPTASFSGIFGSTTAQEILLNDNQISEATADAFASCQFVRTIDLQRNNMSLLYANSFASLPQIRNIYLAENSLSEIVTSSFKDLPLLETVTVDRNRLETIQTAAFDNLPSLGTLDLSYNVIHAIRDDAFAGTTTVTVLALHDNRLSAVPTASLEPLADYLQSLDLSNNLISSLNTSRHFGNLTSLSSLAVRNNSISSYAESCLSGLPALASLDLGENLMAGLPLAFSADTNLTAITSLTVSANQIATINSSAFAGFTSLQTLNLSSNSLSVLDASVFVPFSSTLSSLLLDNNDWHCDCYLNWLYTSYNDAISGGACVTPASEAGNTLGTAGSWVPDTQATCDPTTSQSPGSGEQAAVTTVASEIALTIVTPSSAMTVDVGGAVELACLAIGTLPPTIVWTDPAGAAILSGNHYNLSSSTGSLIITGITSNMGGTYHCNADNANGDTATISVAITVRFPPEIVSFSLAHVSSATSTTLTCGVNAFPYADISWTLPDNTVIDSNSTGTAIVTSSGTLHMVDRLPTDSGYYRCDATNELGNASMSTYLFLYGTNSTLSTITRTLNVGDTTTITCDGLQGDDATPQGFAWTLASQEKLLYAPDWNNDSVGHLAEDGSITMHLHGGATIAISNELILDVASGLLQVMATSNGFGRYSCHTALGTRVYSLVDEAEPTTAASLAIGAVDAAVATSSSEIGELTDLNVYYVVLSCLLFAATVAFFGMFVRLRREKEGKQRDEGASKLMLTAA